VSDERRGAIRRLRSTATLRELIAAYYRELDGAREAGRRVAWCTSVGPVELLRALGFLVYFPENHGALLGATRVAGEVIPAATAAGYSPEICSYLTSDIGAHLRRRSPLPQAYGVAGPPRPDVLVYSTNQCRDVQDWFAFYSRELGVPLCGVHSPRGVGEVTSDHLLSVVAQLQALIAPLAQIAGTRLEPQALRDVVASSRRTSALWQQALRLGAHRPSPLTFFDATIQMAPAVVLRGDPRAESYYAALIAELEERVARGVAAVEAERHRLYWDGMPVWGRLRDHAELLGRRRACVVASTYCQSWVFESLSDEDPLRGMARAMTELFIVRDEAHKERALEAMIGEYGVDAVIYHDAKTCPSNSNDRYGLPGRLAARLDLPYVVLHGDLCDLRLYSDEQARTQLEALIEGLEERR
jgi:benzoyl-CoA reductase/2-hydroxyglutaryl-CoA dehydratase subunit BcrC/BadD/HgdB